MEAMQALLLSAQLAGIDTRPAPPPPVVPAKEVLRMALSDITRDQERAYVWEPVGRGNIGFSVGLDPKADLWAKFRQRDMSVAYPFASLEKGVDADLPVESYRFLSDGGMIRAFPLNEPQSPQANVSVPQLLRGIFDAAQHVLFTPVEYAVLYEDGSLVPGSVSLIREDNAGRFYVSYHSIEELKTIQWFVSINGTMFGMRLEGGDLVFYSKPTPPLSSLKRSPRSEASFSTAPSPRRVPAP